LRILSLETTEMIGSVAAADGDKLLVEMELSRHQRTARSLAPGIKELLEKVGWLAGQVELVAVTRGPGSFTGLRVGLATAKTFAYAAGADIMGVDTLETIAAAAPPEVERLWAAVDAQRGEVVVRNFARGEGGWFRPAGEEELMEIDAWFDSLAEGQVVTGPVFRKLAGRLPEGVELLDQRYWPPMAATVARLAHRHYAAGRRDDVWSLVPRYSRRSAAEEKWEKRNVGRQGGQKGGPER